ncbi:MAG: hypothetical protein EXX96DRAFT_579229 [Benjaminiella poitrasii]|nr:MAG: hypothetical protein EXX96DRAFT_579229 [Benjaminiella poitrasii]
MKCVLNSSVEPITYVRNENGELVCPLCSRLFITTSSVSKHLQNIHNKEENQVEPTTSNFVLNREDAGMIEIYIEDTAWYDAKKLAEDESAQQVYSFNILYQLRQFRSKFHHYSTYFSCRGSSTDANDHIMQPYTAWSYCNFDGQNDEYSDGRIASKLFQVVAI